MYHLLCEISKRKLMLLRLYRLKRFLLFYGSYNTVKTVLFKYLRRCRPNIEEGLTIIISSSGRKQYLISTLKSLKKHLRYSGKIYWHIIDDNPMSSSTRNFIKSEDLDVVLMNTRNKGLGFSLNRIYRTVKTRYIFHCEDDWEFIDDFWIEDLKDELESDRRIGQVILNREQPYKINPVFIEGKAILTRYYSFNPHLLTFDQLIEILPFPNINAELTVSGMMKRKGIKSVVYGYKKREYVRHIGAKKSVEKY